MDGCEVDFFYLIVGDKICADFVTRIVLRSVWNGVSIETLHAYLHQMLVVHRFHIGCHLLNPSLYNIVTLTTLNQINCIRKSVEFYVSLKKVRHLS